MQDTRTGELIPLTPEQADREAKRRDSLDQWIGELRGEIPPRHDQKRQPVIPPWCQGNLPPVADRGAIFAVGEILEIKGGRFRIQRFNGSKLVLKSLPRA